MERFIQHDALFVRHFSTLNWPFPVHNHNHFELVFIHRGSGYHTLNDVRKTYNGRELILLAPADYHIFDIEEETEFTVLKFTNVYLKGLSVSQTADDWNRLIAYLLSLNTTNHSSLISSDEELEKINKLMYLIAGEWKESFNPGNQVIFYLIRAVFALIRKSAGGIGIRDKQEKKDLLIDVADYIHTHIGQADVIKMEALARQFHFSANYLNKLFKEEMGQAVKQYIDTYKLKLIENRLKHSQMSIKDISVEFGFGDLSHFNKFLKKHTGLSPKHFKAQLGA